MNTSALSADQIEYLVQFIHLDRVIRWWAVSDQICASIIGIGPDTYLQIQEKFSKAARDAAEELLEDSGVAGQVDSLPFKPGSIVVGLGDSETDDYQSWLEILKWMLSIRRPQDNIKIVNAGVSGDTSTQILQRFMEIAVLKPSWIVALFGGNDARRNSEAAIKTLVSVEETEKNMQALIELAHTQTKARWVWMTPAAVDEEAILKAWLLAPHKMMWKNQDLACIAHAIKQRPEPVVDLWSQFGNPAKPELLLSDGLHPSLNGHKLIVKALVDKLCSLEIYSPDVPGFGTSSKITISGRQRNRRRGA